jgi:proteic killer suppression protein
LITHVVLTKKVIKELDSIPQFIHDKLEQWIHTVEEIGIEETRKVPGFHDEPLKGKRKGQRSIRLNRSYRAIYVISSSSVLFVEVIEVNKHDY